tara:strand:+ start:2519 stop:3181 length:663 start_codon:yes stop_codon:yes gene_type:complete
MVVMATEQEKQLRRQAFGSGAGTGASRGAALGASFGLPGAAVGAVAGATVGGIRNLIQTQGSRAELADLLRRQEMGTLGLTDQERAVLEQQLMDPQRAIMREQEALGAPQVDDAAIAARMLLGREEQQQKAARDVSKEISAADIQERRAEEARIQQMIAANEKAAAQRSQDNFENSLVVAKAVARDQQLQARLAEYDTENPDANMAQQATGIMKMLFAGG